VSAAQRILSEVDNLKKVGAEFTAASKGALSIATTHTQARYALPGVLPTFRARYPKVMLRIHQGSPSQIVDMVRGGEADLAIATEGVGDSSDLVSMPCYQWNRCVVVPPRHPLLRLRRKVTLEDIGAYPLITYDFAFAGRSQTHRAFAERGITPNVVLTAIDADIIKTYVRLGMGVGLMAAMAFDAKADKPLHAIDVGHLFEPSTTWVGVKKGSFLRGYTVDFIAMFAPHLTRAAIQRSLRGSE
jgi:LysR family cys regulon transcriptional activator